MGKERHFKPIPPCSGFTLTAQNPHDIRLVKVLGWRSSTAEQLICNQQVAGSNPIASFWKIKGLCQPANPFVAFCTDFCPNRLGIPYPSLRSVPHRPSSFEPFTVKSSAAPEEHLSSLW